MADAFMFKVSLLDFKNLHVYFAVLVQHAAKTFLMMTAKKSSVYLVANRR